MPDPRAKLCFALDYPDAAAAIDAARLVREHVGVFKVGLELFLKEGPSVVSQVKSLGRQVFLDLKLHDIPATVAGAVRSALRLDVDDLTVHAAGGPAMLAAASEASSGSNLCLLGVTVLTSMDDAELRAIGVADPAGPQAARLAELVSSAQLGGLVCSPGEVGTLRRRLGGALTLVTPGIRPLGTALGDQKRTGTPAEAISAGASLLVVGRPIRSADDPADAARVICAEIAGAFASPQLP
jgi:orotidine-5'-phosphate decarboxylase